MNKRALLKISFVGILIICIAFLSLIIINISYTQAAEFKKYYLVDEKLKLNLNDDVQRVKLETPSTSSIIRNDKSIIIRLNELGKHKITFFGDEAEEYEFEVVSELPFEINGEEIIGDIFPFDQNDSNESNFTANESFEEVLILNSSEIKVGEKVKWKKEIYSEEELEREVFNIPKSADKVNYKAEDLELKGFVEIYFETPAPLKLETEIDEFNKEVEVYSDLHYENVTAFTNVNEITSSKDQILIYWKDEGRYLDFEAYDLDNDSLIDYIEWLVPHLSNQTFQIIIVVEAAHLGIDKSFISDIHKEIKELDGIYSEAINDGEYARVKFEKKLRNINDITIFPRIVSGNPKIEIYKFNSSVKVSEFSTIKNEEINKAYLFDLVDSEDTFDMKIVGGSVEFDYIIDPIPNVPRGGMFVYGESTIGIPRYRIWNGSGWSEEGNATQTGANIEWVSVASSNVREEYALIVSNSTDGISIQLYNETEINEGCWSNGTACNTSLVLTTQTSSANQQKADVKYEAISGDALVVYSDNTNVPKFIIWNGSGWSVPLAINDSSVSNIGSLSITGTKEIIRLSSSPNNGDEIALVMSDSNDDSEAVIWNGSSWNCESGVLSSGLSTGQYKKVDMVYEQLSGDLVVFSVGGSTTAINITQKQAGVCSFTTIRQAVSNSQQIDAAEQIGSDRVIITGSIYGSTDDMNAGIWNGSTYTDISVEDTSIYSSGAAPNRLISPVWAGRKNGIVVYSDSAGGNVDWFLYNQTSTTWTAPSSDFVPTPVFGGAENNIKSYSFLDENKSFVFIKEDSSRDLWAKIYNGDTNSWSDTEGGSALEDTSSSTEFPSFDFDWLKYMDPLRVNAISPIRNNNYSSTPIYFDVNINNGGRFCNYTLNNGLNNISMQKLSLRNFNSSNSSIIDGNYLARFFCFDNFGFQNLTESVNFTLDTLNPQIIYGGGVSGNGANVSRNWIYVNVSVTEINEANITFILYNSSGVVNNSIFTDKRRTINWTDLTDGSYSYNVTVSDFVSRYNATQTFEINLDNSLPLINFVNPTEINNSLITKRNIIINISASDTSLSNITISIFNSSHSLVNYTVNFTSSDVYYNFSVNSDGIYFFNASASDGVNNKNRTETRQVRIDTSPPLANIISPVNNQNYTSTPIFFNISTNENSSATFTLNGGVNNYTMTVNSSGTGFNFTNSSIADGNYLVRFYVNDSAGNRNYTSTSNFTLDTSFPSIILNSPLNNTEYNYSSILFNFTITDISSLSSVIFYFNSTNYSYSSPVNIDLLDGNYTLHIYANDSLGNLNHHISSFSVNKLPNITFFYSNGSGAVGETSVLNSYNGLYDISLQLIDLNNSLLIYGFNKSGNQTLIYSNYTNEAFGTGGFAISLEGMLFSHANISLNASGTHLYKCADWNMTSLTCLNQDSWDVVSKNELGSIFNLTLSPGDPGFLQLVIANAQILDDGYASQIAPATEYGARNVMVIANSSPSSNSHPMISFNISGLPNGIIIDNANLTLRCSLETLDAGEAIGVGAHLVYSNYSWTEGTGGAGGNACAIGEFCWNNRPQYNTTVDYSLSIPDGCVGTNYTFDVTDSIMQAYSQSYRNVSIYLVPTGINTGTITGDEVRFNTKEAATANQRPKLNITYHSIPSVILISPLANTTFNYSQIVELRVNASDIATNISSVYANITLPNGTVEIFLMPNISSQIYSYNYTIPPLIGRYNVTFIANNTDNYINSSQITSFNAVDQLHPSINFTNPTEINGSLINRRNIIVNVSVSDLFLSNISIFVFNSSHSLVNSTVNTTSSSAYYNFSVNSDGTYYFNATAYDQMNNVNNTGTYSISIDTIIPIVNFTSPTSINGSELEQDFIYANVSINELNFANITFTLYNSTALVNSTFYSSLVNEINWSNLSSLNATYYFNVSVFDLHNNMNKTETRQIKLVDITPPSILLSEPMNRTYYENNSLSLLFSTSDAHLSDCWYHVDSGSNVSLPNCESTPINVSEGSHILFLYANDSLGLINRANVTFVANQSLLPRRNGILVYSEGSAAPTSVRYRIWDGNSFSGELNALTSSGVAEWMSVKNAPSRDEQIIIIANSFDDVNVRINSTLANGTMCWHNGTDCNLFLNLTLTSSAPSRQKADVAYESYKGDAIIVYNQNNVSLLYKVWNGTAFGATSLVPQTLITGGVISYVKMASNPLSDEIALIMTNTSALNAIIWNGSEWSCEPSNLLSTTLSTGVWQHADLTYEQNSGDLFIANTHSTATEMNYTIKSNGVCSFSTFGTSAINMAEQAEIIRVGARYESDYIMITNEDTSGAANSEDLQSIIWNGSALINLSGNEVTAYTATSPNIPIAPVWAGTSNHGIAIYSDAATSLNMDYFGYNISNLAWDGGNTGLDATGHTNFADEEQNIKAYSFIERNRSMIIIKGDADDLWAKYFDGDTRTFGDLDSGTAFETTVSSTSFPAFDFEFNYDRSGPDIYTRSPFGYKNSSSVLLNVSTAENSISCVYSMDGAINLSMSYTDSKNYNYLHSSIANGVHNVIFSCEDKWENSRSVTSQFTVDTVSPIIQFNSATPANASELQQNFIFVNVTINEINFANITYELRNSTALVNSTIYNTSITNITWTGLNGDLYYFNVSVYDLAGNFNKTETRTVNLTRTSSRVNLIYPVNGANFTGYSISEFNFSVYANASISNCSLMGSWGTGWHVNQTVLNPSLEQQINFSSIIVGNDGYYLWNVYCRDNLNVLGYNATNFTFSTFLPAESPVLLNITQTSNDGNGNLTLYWNSSNHSYIYRIYAVNSLNESFVLINSTNRTNYTDSNFSGNNRKFYIVSGWNPISENYSYQKFGAHVYRLSRNINTRNWIGMPSNASYLINANSSLYEIRNATAFTMWNATSQRRVTCNSFSCPNVPSCTSTNCNFGLTAGVGYEVNINSSGPVSLNWSLVGIVYDPVNVTLIKNATSFGKNWIALPANTTLTLAQSIYGNITGADAVSRWNSTLQTSQGLIRNPLPFGPTFIGNNFNTILESGYEVSVNASSSFIQR